MTYERALEQAKHVANRCMYAYIYRLTDGTFYVSHNPPGMINVALVTTVARSLGPTATFEVRGEP